MINHYTSRQFWMAYRRLPPEIRVLARQRYRLLLRDPRHPSLRFEKKGPLWSARVGSYRALAKQIDDGFLWFWIGTHDDYERLLRNRR